MKEEITTSLVLKVNFISEADLLVDLLSGDLGRINVVVKGVRLMKSKLRYSLEPCSIIEASIIDSRIGPRLINAQLIKNIYYDTKNTTSNHEAVGRFIHLLDRVVPPDELNDWHREVIEWLINNKLTTNNLTIVVGYLLYQLGYLDLEGYLGIKVQSLDHLLRQSFKVDKSFNQLISQTIVQTHL